MKNFLALVVALGALALPGIARATAAPSPTVDPTAISFNAPWGTDVYSLEKTVTLTNTTSSAIGVRFVNPGSSDPSLSAPHDYFSLHTTAPLSFSYNSDSAGVGAFVYNGAIQPGDSMSFTLDPVNYLNSPGTYSDTFAVEWTPEQVTNWQPISLPITATVGPNTTVVKVIRSSVSVRTFYPLVRDGYRDGVRYSASLNMLASGSVQVVNNRSGKVIRSFRFSGRGVSRVWNGLTSGGRKVKIGYFHFVIHARANHSSTSGGGQTVRVRTGWKITRVHKSRTGLNTSDRSGSSCYFENNNYVDGTSGALTLDSWGGSCTATYFVSVPSGATNVTFGIGTHIEGWENISGPTGHSAIRTASGVSFSASASSWAALRVSGVKVNFTTRRRI